jgi:hypothetical protein
MWGRAQTACVMSARRRWKASWSGQADFRVATPRASGTAGKTVRWRASVTRHHSFPMSESVDAVAGGSFPSRAVTVSLATYASTPPLVSLAPATAVPSWDQGMHAPSAPRLQGTETERRDYGPIPSA